MRDRTFSKICISLRGENPTSAMFVSFNKGEGNLVLK